MTTINPTTAVAPLHASTTAALELASPGEQLAQLDKLPVEYIQHETIACQETAHD